MIILLPLLLLVWVAVTSNQAIARQALPLRSPISERVDDWLRRSLFVLSLVLGIGGVIPLAGIPGEPWLVLAEPLAQRACPPGSLRGFGPNASWPSAMMIAAAWPAGFLPVYRLIRQSASRAALTMRALIGVVLMAGYGVALGLLMYVGYCRWP